MCARSWSYRRGRLARLLGIYGISLVSACGLRNADLNLLLNGPVSNFDGPGIEIYVDNRERILSAISRDAGFGGRSPVNPSEWNQFVIAAFGYADAQCEDYMSALRRLDIVRREATQQINLVGAATVGILGIAQVAATAIAMTGVAFGLTQATVDNLTSGLLYDLPPSTIYGLVNRMKLAYASNLPEAEKVERSSSLRTIRGYIELLSARRDPNECDKCRLCCTTDNRDRQCYLGYAARRKRRTRERFRSRRELRTREPD